MKQTVLLMLVSLAFVAKMPAQIKEGIYYMDDYFMHFNTDSVDFKVMSNGGLTVDIYASGTYEWLNDFLIIYTGSYHGKKTTFIKRERQGDGIKIAVVDPAGIPINGANVVLTDQSNHILSGTATKVDGTAFLKVTDEATTITVSFLGYDRFSFDYSDQFDYRITLMDYRIIENQSVVFKVHPSLNDTLTLTLLSTDFNFKRNKAKALKALYRKSHKQSVRKWHLIKLTGANKMDY